MPSANYLDKDFVTVIGQQAIDDYITGNRGRTVELSAELLGEKGPAQAAKMVQQEKEIQARFMDRHLTTLACQVDYLGAPSAYWATRAVIGH